MKKLEGKVALVTGGNSGIGLATAKLYRDHGARVIITARSPETFETARKEYGQVFDVVQADVSDPGQLDRLFAHIQKTYDGLDVLFANAGIAQFTATAQATVEFYDRHFDTNVRGLYFTVAKALPLLRKGSSVILNASVLASKGFAGGSIYSATKAAVRSFARSWTAEIPVEQARFNVLSPGPVETPIYDKLGLGEEQKQGMAMNVPAKRFGRPEEMASIALFLASSDSSYMAGADVVADGGMGQV